MKKVDREKTVPSIQTYDKSLLAPLGKLRWSNKYDCPAGYEYNDDGYVETNENHLQITVNMMPHLIGAIGEYGILYQNALAFRALNPNKHRDYIEPVLSNKFRTVYFRMPNRVLLVKALDDAYSVDSLGDVLSTLHRGIFSFHSIWYNRDCPIGNRKKIFSKMREDFIDSVRNDMTIDTKYKTVCVAECTEESLHVIKVYWRSIGLDRKSRTSFALSEALESLATSGVERTTIKELCEISGLSRNTVGELLSKNDHYDTV